MPSRVANSIQHMQHFSFIEGDMPWWERTLIQLTEELLGKRKLARIYEQVVATQSSGKTFWHRTVEQMQLSIETNGLPLEQVPAQGPLLVVANHPYGQIDGVVLSHLIETLRPDYQVIAWEILNAADQLEDVVLPISFKEDYRARRNNLVTLRRSIQSLQSGRTVILFPAGSTSVSPGWFGPAVDAPWQKFLAKLIAAANPTVLPVYVHGQNSRLFQISSHLSYNLKLSLFFHEMIRMCGQTVQLTIGSPLTDLQAAAREAEPALLTSLYQQTMALPAQHTNAFMPFRREDWARWTPFPSRQAA